MSPDTEPNPAETAAFDALRPRLTGLAYRILGSISDAEDAVQDTFVKWAVADRASVANHGGWLVTACTRRCLDIRRAGYRARVDYVGAWLPEPIQLAAGADEEAELAASISTACLVVMERLTPKERAAFLLHDVFDMPHAEVGRVLGVSEAASRKLASRARGRLRGGAPRQAVAPERQKALLAAFEAAARHGRSEPLRRLLAADARLIADGGGKVPAILQPVEGRDAVLDFVIRDLRRYWAGHAWTGIVLNGTPGLRIGPAEAPVAALSLGLDADGAVRDIFIVRNPDKLTRLSPVAIR